MQDKINCRKIITDGYKVVLRVVYLDKGTDSWELRYDDDALDHPEKVAAAIKNEDTGVRREITVEINDGCFYKCCPNSTDIMLVHQGGDNTLFHMVELIRK